MIQPRVARLRHGAVTYAELGSGPPLVLVHGLGGNWQNWLANIPTLAERHRVVAPDLPGFGRSGQLAGATTMGRLADTIVELMDVLGIESATLVGNSMGGLLTIEVAVRNPDRVERAILVCSGGIPLTTWRHRLLVVPVARGLNRALSDRRVRRAVLRRPVARHAVASWIVSDAGRVETARLVAALEGLGAPGFGAALRGGLAYDTRTRAPHVRCPSLILWGRDDRLLPLSMGEQLHELIPGSELVVWDDTGHCPMIEHPERFDELVTAFVDGRSAIKALTSDG